MTSKNWDPDFIEYMDFIRNHENYEGMPEPDKQNGDVRWVVTGTSKLGKKRRDWWRKKAEEVGVSTEGHWLSKTAREIHPTGIKPCQICGQELSINYVYPNKTTLKQLNGISGLEVEFEEDDFLEIDEIVEIIFDNADSPEESLRSIFYVPEDRKSRKDFKDYILNNCGKNGSGKLKLSPGVMSNPPDRFDGFHTYNKCCRKKEDTGRHDENMRRYGQDRRAYENWAQGDFKSANRFMRKISGKNGVCVICGEEMDIVPDHVGPISLGFKHRPRFQPMCESCNAC
jgi:Alw26I/Eco31I/Esp3I family type II restriction endonuclease